MPIARDKKIWHVQGATKISGAMAYIQFHCLARSKGSSYRRSPTNRGSWW